MPAVRSRAQRANGAHGAAHPAVFLSNADHTAPAAAIPPAVRMAPPSAAEFSHSLYHDVAQQQRAHRLAAELKRHGAAPGRGPQGDVTPRLDSRWNNQLAVRRRWFEAQLQAGRGVQTPPREQSITLITEALAADEGHDCSQHASLDHARTHKGGCRHSHHQDPRGLLMVDLDEAAHGVYASVKQALPAFKGEGLGAIREEFVEQGELLDRDPLGWMAHEVPTQGVGDFSAAMGTSALVAPLAVIAIKAGIHEARDAKAIAKDLHTRAQQQADNLDRMKRLASDPAAPPLLKADLVAADRSLKDTRFAKRINRLRFGIGVMSAASGATIFVKSMLDVALKSALVAAAKKFNVAHFVAEHGVATAAVTAAGVAGTLVLGPLAGIFATGLGAFFARKSALRHRAFKADRARVSGLIQKAAEAAEPLPESVGRYTRFIERKLPQRARFYRRFKRWNISFLGGSSLYAASALTKAALGIAALAGLGALITNPVGWGVLMGVGVVGAVMMGVSSWQFLFGHPKNERYERYFRDDNPDLDRAFLSKLDLLPPPPDRGPWAALELRAKLFQSLESRSEALDFIKHRAAKSLGKKPRFEFADWKANLAAGVQAGWAAGRRFTGSFSIKQARGAASQTWREKAAHLSRGAFEKWLAEDEADLAWQSFIHRHVLAQIDYIEDKLAYRLAVCEQHTRREGGPEVGPPQAASDHAAWLSELDAGLERDQSMLERLNLMLEGAGDRDSRKRMMLAILSGVKPEALDDMPAEKIRAELVTTLWTDLPKRLRDTKGMLLETELQAGRLRADQEAAAMAVVAGEGERAS